MFKYIDSFHSEVVVEPKQERAEVRSFPAKKQSDEIVIEPWLRKALDEQKLKRRGANYGQKIIRSAR